MGTTARAEGRADACGRTRDCPLTTACAPDRSAPCASVEELHREKLALCDALEALADSLPRDVNRFHCLKLGSALTPVIRYSHDFEERNIFPAFAQADDTPGRRASIARLKTEHVVDECAAAEVSEELLRIGHGGEIANPEALGFMLRALFEAMRRHIAFEREHVLPMLDDAHTASHAAQ